MQWHWGTTVCSASQEEPPPPMKTIYHPSLKTQQWSGLWVLLGYLPYGICFKLWVSHWPGMKHRVTKFPQKDISLDSWKFLCNTSLENQPSCWHQNSLQGKIFVTWLQTPLYEHESLKIATVRWINMGV